HIGIVVSVPAEGSILARALRKEDDRNHLYYKGILAGRPVVLGISGIGKVNAAHMATRLIHAYSPSLMMNIGVGGAYPSSGLEIGDVAIAEKETYADEGVMLKDGFHGTELIGIPLLKKGRRKYFNEFPFDQRLVGKAVKTLAFRPPPFAVRTGPFATVSTCTGTAKRAREIEWQIHAICENMEGAAVAHICAIYGVPLMEMRGISNMVGDRDRSGWDVRLAAENCQTAALQFLKVV
ncbi:MAG TPA: futalosine hydrolase, partial [Thermodesulfovibrionales bacterium]|nr:futalosine hydrolase [Thermodesulfovibrionales bacterium]